MCLLSRQEALAVVTNACNPNTWKGEAGGSDVHIYPPLHVEVKVSRSYMRLCLKN